MKYTRILALAGALAVVGAPLALAESGQAQPGEVAAKVRAAGGLVIADEVQYGFGRSGTHFWGFETHGVVPDLVTIAKGVTSAYFPLSGVLVSEPVWRTLCEGEGKFGPFGHGYTYSAHPIGAAVGLANLDIMEKENLVEAAAIKGKHLHEQLQAAFADHPLTGEIRGFGLVGAVEFVEKKDQ